jgi:vitamin B12 transporter
MEAGLYHQAELVAGALGAELSLAAYQMDMRDELDFDFQSFRYINIGRSRHRGVESGLRLYGAGATGAFVNYTLQSVTSRLGEHEGKYLKAIPRHILRTGASTSHTSGLGASLTATSAWGIYLDDANTITLPGYTRVDAGLSYPIRRVRLSVEVFNLLDREYSTTGFPDFAGSGEIFYFPAAGRVIQVGMSMGQ